MKVEGRLASEARARTLLDPSPSPVLDLERCRRTYLDCTLTWRRTVTFLYLLDLQFHLPLLLRLFIFLPNLLRILVGASLVVWLTIPLLLNDPDILSVLFPFRKLH